MSIASKLGSNYESVRTAIKLKTISIQVNDGEFTLKVRVPVKREMEQITEKVRNPNEDLIETLYQKLAGPLRKTIEDANPDLIKALNTQESEIKILENDVLVSGTSVRNIAQLQASWQIQVEQYFGLLQSVTGEPITESFEEITEEFPENAIKEIIAQIDKAIRPNYQDTKKNSELH